MGMARIIRRRMALSGIRRRAACAASKLWRSRCINFREEGRFERFLEVRSLAFSVSAREELKKAKLDEEGRAKQDGRTEETKDKEQEGDKKENKETVPDERHLLLEKALDHVLERGWSRAALRAAADELGWSPSAAGLLERGEIELVEFFLERCNNNLKKDLKSMEEELNSMRVRERIRTAVKIRLEMLVPYINVWPQALAMLAHPANVPRAVSMMATMVDDIWMACGDTSQDYNWYTKRGLLVGLYSSTELYMLTDTSPHFENTWKFLDRRIDDVMKAGKSAGQLGNFAKSALGNYDKVLRVIFSKGQS